MAGVQFPATGCGCPKRGAKAQTSAAEPMGSGPIGSQQICCLCTRKKHEEEFKDLAFYELHFFRICWICNQDSSLCVSVRWPWRNLKQCLCQVLMTWHSHHWWVPILSPCGGRTEEWMDMDEWMNGWLDEFMGRHEWMNGWMDYEHGSFIKKTFGMLFFFFLCFLRCWCISFGSLAGATWIASPASCMPRWMQFNWDTKKLRNR